MKSFEKMYIGKGKQVNNLDIIRLTCKLEDLQTIAYEIEGTRYVTIEVARMKAPDTYGRTHSAYYNKMVEILDAPKPKNIRKPAPQKQASPVNLPF